MILRRLASFFLAGALAGSLAAQGDARTLDIEGLAFKLPQGWAWQSEFATNIAIKRDFKVKDQSYTATAEMIYSAKGFLEDSIKDIEKKVAASKGDLAELKITRGQKFAGSPAVMVTYARVRGSGPADYEDETQYLLRRNNSLYVWTERVPRAIRSQAASALGAARNAITFTKKDESRLPKIFGEEGLKYVLPADWEHDAVKPSDDPKLVSPIMLVETAATVKGQTWPIRVALFAYKNSTDLSSEQKRAKDTVTRDFKDVADFQLLDKQVFNGEKAFVTTFNGKSVPDGKDDGADRPTIWRRDVFMKRKGYLIRWIETCYFEPNAVSEAALKKARAGLTFQ